MADQTQILNGEQPDDWVRLSDHPRAKASINRAKAFGGLIGFILGFWLAQSGGLPAFDTGVRALVGGISGYVLVWLAAVQIWRQLAIAEFKAAEKKRAAVRKALRERNEEKARERREAADAAAQARREQYS
jgi:hypothetical protein